MANQNTKAARKRGYPSQKDSGLGTVQLKRIGKATATTGLGEIPKSGHKIYKGAPCDTRWNAEASKRKSPWKGAK